MSDSQYRKGVLQAIVAGAFLSTAGIGMRLLDSATPLQVTFYRALGLSLLMLIVITWRTGGKPLKALLNIGVVGMAAGLAYAAASWSVIFAFAETTVANVMFIVSLAPCFAALFAWALLRERVGRKTWTAIFIALIGVLVMINGALSAEGLLGIAYAFSMATAYGLFMVLARMGKNRDMLPAIFWSGLFLATVCSFGINDFVLTPKDTAISLSLGIFQVGMGGLLLVAAAKHIPAAQITFLAMLEVVLSPVWVWLGVGEVPSNTTLIGGAIIMAAIVYLAATATHNSAVPRRE